jgi:dihydropteroate synthase
MAPVLVTDSTPGAPRQWSIAGRTLDLVRPLVMGIVNVTPDSFSDGGRYFDRAVAIAHGQRLIDDGAVPISVDTSKPGVMRAALMAGAAIINDVRALQEPGAAEAVRSSDCGIVLMHMQGTPRTMQQEPHYNDVVTEVAEFLRTRIAVLNELGVRPDRIAIDPGFGFGKSLEHNYTLLRGLRSLLAMGCPVLVGLSRKSMLGAVTGRTVDSRLAASLAAAVLAVERGARIVRVHDVAATRDALRVWMAVQEGVRA